MIITIKSLEAWRVAQACSDPKGYGSSMKGICVKPSGFVAGSNGFCGVYHLEGVEPFEGVELNIRPSKTLPKTAISATIDTEAGLLLWVTKSHKAEVMKVSVQKDLLFPDIERITPSQGVALEDDVIGFNVEYAYKISQALDSKMGQQMTWQLSGSGSSSPMRLITEDPGLVVILVPLRTGSDLKRPNPPKGWTRGGEE